MIKDFGKYLKSEREMRGIPLEEIAENTKIQMRFLEALETNYYEILPGEVFVRSFVQSYAKAIGADIDEIIKKFDETVGHQRKDEIQKTEFDKNKAYLRSRKVYRLIVVVILIILCGVAGFGINKLFNTFENSQVSLKSNPISKTKNSLYSDKNTKELNFSKIKSIKKKIRPTIKVDKTAKRETLKLNNHIVKDDAIVDRNIKKKSLESGKKEEINKSLEDISGSTNLKLTIRVTQKSWFHLIIDGEREEDFILPENTAKVYRGKLKFKITIGNHEGVRLALNGKALKLPISEDNVIRDFLIKPETLNLDQ